jgi:hypothetical protein
LLGGQDQLGKLLKRQRWLPRVKIAGKLANHAAANAGLMLDTPRSE